MVDPSGLPQLITIRSFAGPEWPILGGHSNAMITTASRPTYRITDEDRVSQWLQDREMKDRRIGEARRGALSVVERRAVVERWCEKGVVAFPAMLPTAVAEYVNAYFDRLMKQPQ